MKAVARPLAVAAVALFCATPADSTIIIRKDLLDLVRESEAIVLARVVSNTAAWDADRRFIWTWTTLDVVETWKGAAAGRIALREPGGEVGPTGMRVAGTPKYAVGEEVVVFLRRDAHGALRTHGWTQGRFSVAADDAFGGALIARASHPHVLAGRFDEDARRGPLGVDYVAFRSKVRLLVAVVATEGPK